MKCVQGSVSEIAKEQFIFLACVICFIVRMEACKKYIWRLLSLKTHYYFSWFNDFFPEKLVKLLQEDVQDRKSLVMISADPSGYTGEQINFDDVSEWRWLNQANIILMNIISLITACRRKMPGDSFKTPLSFFYAVDILFCRTIS